MGMDIWEQISRKAWQSRFFTLPQAVRKVPTMLTADEGRMLAWLAQHAYTGAGAVCDMGCFLGGSTVRLALGLARSRKPWHMHSYDRFEASEGLKEKYLYAAGYPRYEGTDTLPIFQQHIQPYADHITIHRGDVQSAPWSGEPIEILFIDLSKTNDLNNFILSSFFTALIPGRSIIIQQDYLHFRTPWLVTTMELLHPKIEMIGWANDYSVLYRCNERITAADVAAVDFAKLAPETVRGLFAQARERFPFLYQREMVDLALRAWERRPDARQSWVYPDVLGDRWKAITGKRAVGARSS